MQVKLILKEAYTLTASISKRQWSNDCGFVQTFALLPIGAIISFEDLRCYSNAGDLSTNHYKYFAGRLFRSVKPSYPTIDVQLNEI